MNIKLKTDLLSVIGLFFPVKFKKEWCFTMTIGRIPLGWIVIVVSYLARFIP